MIEDLKDQFVAVEQILRATFVETISTDIKRHQQFVTDYKKLVARLIRHNFPENKVAKNYAYLAGYKDALLTLVEEHFNKEAPFTLDVKFDDYKQAIIDYTNTLAEQKIYVQTKERYYKQPDDTALTGTTKYAKRQVYNVAKWPEKLVNTGRGVFGKSKRPIKKWKQKIRLRQAAHYYFGTQLPQQLTSVLDIYNEEVLKSLQKSWHVDEQIDHVIDQLEGGDGSLQFESSMLEKIDESLHDLASLEKIVSEGAKKALADIRAIYETDYPKIGTLELSNSRFSNRNITVEYDKVNTLYSRHSNNWVNTYQVLADDWEIDIELYEIIYEVRSQYAYVQKNLAQIIENDTLKSLDELRSIIRAAKLKISESKNKETVISNELTRLQEEFTNDAVPQVINQLLEKDIPNIINKVESTLDELIVNVSNKRAVVKGADYNKPIKSSSISYISPYELITFETWPQFLKVTNLVKATVSEKLGEAQAVLMNLGQIAEFNLQSALSIFKEEDGIEDAEHIAQEGLDRTLSKIDEVGRALKDIDDLVDQQLAGGLDIFAQELDKFTNSENIYELRMRIARGKAVARSKALRQQVITSARTLIPQSLKYIKDNYTKGREQLNRTFKRYGLATGKAEITSELADFLAENKQAVERLPFVYQRLFKVESLDDPVFFEGRRLEINEMLNAYHHWTRGRFAAVSLIGEKGAGITSLLNFFLKELSTSADIIRISPDKTIFSEKELIELLSGSLNKYVITLDQLIEAFNSDAKKVIVIENIQNLYLKKVNGFKALALLTELISLTNKNVFWVAGCTLHSWHYLDKTIRISDHFSYPIPLVEFSDDTIVNIINKRHKVSGYNTIFEPSLLDRTSVKFKKMSPADQQSLLSRRYFADLNKIARSNISLALMYWLRSTSEINGTSIHIKSLSDMNFSFLSTLSQDKLYVLTLLLLHDGLSEENFKLATGSKSNQVRSLIYPMFEDGIIIKEKDQYFINPLLYRQTVTLLKTKNIIH